MTRRPTLATSLQGAPVRHPRIPLMGPRVRFNASNELVYGTPSSSHPCNRGATGSGILSAGQRAKGPRVLPSAVPAAQRKGAHAARGACAAPLCVGTELARMTAATAVPDLAEPKLDDIQGMKCQRCDDLCNCRGGRLRCLLHCSTHNLRWPPGNCENPRTMYVRVVYIDPLVHQSRGLHRITHTGRPRRKSDSDRLVVAPALARGWRMW